MIRSKPLRIARLSMAVAAAVTAVAVMVPLPQVGRSLIGSTEKPRGSSKSEQADTLPAIAVPGDSPVASRPVPPLERVRPRRSTPLSEPTPADPIDAEDPFAPGDRPDSIARQSPPTNRVASRDEAGVVPDVPRRPVDDNEPSAVEPLPPEPLEPVAPPATRARRAAVPRVELGPIEQQDERSPAPWSRKADDALSMRSSHEPWVNVQLVLQGDLRAPAPPAAAPPAVAVADAASSATAARTDERLARLEDRLAELLRREDDLRASRLEESSRRVETMQQSLHLQQLEQQIRDLKERLKSRARNPATSPASTVRTPDEACAPTEETDASAESRTFVEPKVGTDPESEAAGAAARTWTRASTSAARESTAPAASRSDLPQILPGPPFYRPGGFPAEGPSIATGIRQVSATVVIPRSGRDSNGTSRQDSPAGPTAPPPAVPSTASVPAADAAPPNDSPAATDDGSASGSGATAPATPPPGSPLVPPPVSIVHPPDVLEQQALPDPPPPLDAIRVASGPPVASAAPRAAPCRICPPAPPRRATLLDTLRNMKKSAATRDAH